MENSRHIRTKSFREFLEGGKKQREYVILDPSTYAAEFAGKPGGYPTYEDNLSFHKAFENDSPISAFVFPEDIVPELKWERSFSKQKGEENYYKETLKLPSGRTSCRVVAERPGTQPWIVQAPVKEENDFELIEYYAEQTKENAALFAEKFKTFFNQLKSEGFMAGMVLLTPFEVYYLIDYPDMPLFYYDHKDTYLNCVEKVTEANIAVASELVKIGCEVFYMGSAGLELLSPRIFDEAIIPSVRRITDHIRDINAFSSYHICGHSYQLLESGRINSMKPTWFETFSTAPCGNNPSLSESLKLLDDSIISKGNLALELLRNGSPSEIREETIKIMDASKERSHIIGQADATILSATPQENIRAFLETAGGI